MIVRRFHYFRSGPSVFYINTEALVGLRALRSWMQSIVSRRVLSAVGLARPSNLVIEIVVVVLVPLGSAISRPEATEARGIHLLLQKVAVVRIVNVCVILQSLHQVCGVMQEITEA